MKRINRLNLAMLAAASAALIVTTTSLKADLHPPVNILPIHANAGVTAVLTGTSDPLVFTATATGVVQTTLPGTYVENAQLTVRFPATAGQPVVLNGTGLALSKGTRKLLRSTLGLSGPCRHKKSSVKVQHTAFW